MEIVDADAVDQTKVWTVIDGVRDDIQSDSKLRTRAMDEPSDSLVFDGWSCSCCDGVETKCPRKIAGES